MKDVNRWPRKFNFEAICHGNCEISICHCGWLWRWVGVVRSIRWQTAFSLGAHSIQPFWWHTEISACQLSHTMPVHFHFPPRRRTQTTRGKVVGLCRVFTLPPPPPLPLLSIYLPRTIPVRLNEQTTLRLPFRSPAAISTFHPFPRPPNHPQQTLFGSLLDSILSPPSTHLQCYSRETGSSSSTWRGALRALAK